MAHGSQLDAMQLRDRARVALYETPPPFVPKPGPSGLITDMPARGDHNLNPDIAPSDVTLVAAKQAAVLVPIVARSPLTVLLTKRASHLNRHAGQIAFPGGRTDEGDGSALMTALREAEEEIALAAHHIEPLGYLERYRTGTGYDVTPVVALIDPAHESRPDPNEVDAVFEVPLAFLLDPANVRQDEKVWQGRPRRYYVLHYRQHYIWGATAGILKNLQERLTQP